MQANSFNGFSADGLVDRVVDSVVNSDFVSNVKDTISDIGRVFKGGQPTGKISNKFGGTTVTGKQGGSHYSGKF